MDEKNFNLSKEVNGELLLISRWTDCMSYEFELRKRNATTYREDSAAVRQPHGAWRRKGTPDAELVASDLHGEFLVFA